MSDTDDRQDHVTSGRGAEPTRLALARLDERTPDTGQGERRARRTPRRKSTANLHVEIRQDVQVILGEWLNERSSSLAMALSHQLEGYLPKVRREHAGELADVRAEFEARVQRLERELDESRRGMDRRTRDLLAGIEQDWRERLDRLQQDLDAATLDAQEKIRDVQRLEREDARLARRDLEDRLRQKDEEIQKLKQAHLAEVTLLKRTFDRDLAARDKRSREMDPPRR